MIFTLIFLTLTLGLYCMHQNETIGVVLLGLGTNLLILQSAIPGHPLTQSLVLTAVVIGAGTVAMWSRHS